VNSSSADALMKRKVLLVDDPSQESFVRELLREEFELSHAHTLEEAIASAVVDRPELIVLDLFVGVDGQEFCRILKNDQSTTKEISILCIASGSAQAQQAEGLPVVDTLIRPFRPSELLFQISAFMEKSVEDVLSYGNLEIKLHRIECRSAGELIELSMLEFDLLVHFVKNPGKIVTRDEILGAVWAGALLPGRRTIDTHICALRRKILNSDLSFRTLYGSGYVLQFKNKSRSIASRLRKRSRVVKDASTV
jgi:DNA-binding response OmpR family regulator